MPASADFIATSTGPAGGLSYVGLGERMAGSNQGSGNFTYGFEDCMFDGVNTTCTVSGEYTESAGSNDPGATGSFVFRQIWTGDGVSPFIVESAEPFGNVVQGVTLGGATLEVDIFADDGRTFTGITPADPFANSAQFSFIGVIPGACTGLDAGVQCSLGQVGLVPGAMFTTDVDVFFITIPEAGIIPVPAAVWLFGSALGLLGWLRRKA
ncbi:MAG: hypothetical protein QNJ73_16290 [Gammaproteobacteria bacterium]|nr:hypothetical protein [Gammaproteobacteria bacterium]